MRRLAAIDRESAGGRGGLTLLEVLIACGLLVIGLTTMAALLPAAGFRLAQAHIEDRASALSTNALADVMNRRLLSVDSFTGASAPALTLGAVLGRLPSFGMLPSGRDASAYFAALSQTGRARSGCPRTFQLEDDLIYTPPVASDTPSNTFTSTAAGLGARTFDEGMCWGAILTPERMPPKPGDAATLTITVFKRGEASTVPTPVILTRTNGFYEADILPAGSLLRACGWVLAIPPSPDRAAAWFQIMSSWTLAPPATQTTRLILRNQEAFETLTGAKATGSTATILVFEGLVRSDQHRVTLH
jgi:hypothetical protein